MKIDKNKPLPDHTKLDYDECCVLITLQALFPDRYKDLTISDKPDLQGIDIGVEVTIADTTKHQEALNNWSKAVSCDDEIKKKKYIDRMSQLGVRYTGGIQFWPTQTPTAKYICDAVDSKVSKAKKGNYKSFMINELFIITDTWIREEIKQQIQDYLIEKNVYIFFERIYVFEKGLFLFVFEKNNVQYIEVISSEQTSRNIRAREMVEEAEEE